jgi:hypothetical protein
MKYSCTHLSLRITTRFVLVVTKHSEPVRLLLTEIDAVRQDSQRTCITERFRDSSEPKLLGADSISERYYCSALPGQTRNPHTVRCRPADLESLARTRCCSRESPSTPAPPKQKMATIVSRRRPIDDPICCGAKKDWKRNHRCQFCCSRLRSRDGSSPEPPTFVGSEQATKTRDQNGR